MGWNSSLLISSQALEERPLGSPPLHQVKSVPGSWTWGLGEGAKNWDGDPKKRWDVDVSDKLGVQWQNYDFHQLVGGWATPLKNMKVNGDDEIPNIWENKKWQPNHQPENMVLQQWFLGVPSTFKPCTVCQSGSECTFREGLRALEVLPSWQWQRNHPQQQTVTGGSFYILVMGVCPISLNFIKPLLLGIV